VGSRRSITPVEYQQSTTSSGTMTTGEPTAQVGTGQSTAITTDKASASNPPIQRGFDIFVGNDWL